MDYGHTTAKNEEEFWREMRHSEDNPPCDIRLVCHNGRYVPAVRSLRRLMGGDEVTVNFRNVPSEILDRFPDFAAIVAKKLSAYDKEMKKKNVLVEANKELYHANKKLSAENTAMELKLAQKKRTIGSLVSKMEAKNGMSVKAGGDVIKRLPNAVRILLEQPHGGNGGEPNAVPTDSANREIVTLTAQLEKLNTHNENLNDELARLRRQQGELRQQKKDNDGKKKP